MITLDAAFGMEYLHLKNIVHFDLKCDNLLVNLRDTQRPICKVTNPVSKICKTKRFYALSFFSFFFFMLSLFELDYRPK